MGSDSHPAYEYTALKETTIDVNDTGKTSPSFGNESETFGTSFEKNNSRLGFIQKVLCIKLLQVMVVTLIMVCFACGGRSMYYVMIRDLTTRINFIVVSSLVFVAVAGSLNYCKDARTSYPYNYIFLVAFPLSGGVFGCVVFYGWALNSMLVSWVHFNLVVLALLLYSNLSFDTKIEFKTRTGLYIAGSMLVVMYSFTIPFVYGINGFAVLYFSLMLFLTTAYILYDIEAMVSKDYRAPLTPADFVTAAVLMHVDHRYLFMRTYSRHKRSNPA